MLSRLTTLAKNKRGEEIAADATFWIFRILLILILVFSLIFFVNTVIKKNIDTGTLELDLVAARILYSPGCLSKSDEIRNYPGIIDKEKYDENYLKLNCIKETDRVLVGLMISLEGQNPIYINQEYYEDVEPLTFSKRYNKAEKNLPVIVGNETKALKIIVVAEKR
ncbi:hypothetical protein GOV08_05155 [Candidatus Woesearchaeota archaeon]|nr:hypothetical protein [Candidatus Woesearchaeota archaeon]